MKMGSLYDAPSQIIEAFSGELSTTTPSLATATRTDIHVKEKKDNFGDKSRTLYRHTISSYHH